MIHRDNIHNISQYFFGLYCTVFGKLVKLCYRVHPATFQTAKQTITALTHTHWADAHKTLFPLYTSSFLTYLYRCNAHDGKNELLDSKTWIIATQSITTVLMNHKFVLILGYKNISFIFKQSYQMLHAGLIFLFMRVYHILVPGVGLIIVRVKWNSDKRKERCNKMKGTWRLQQQNENRNGRQGGKNDGTSLPTCVSLPNQFPVSICPHSRGFPPCVPPMPWLVSVPQV